jgi:hypothetical protein
MASTGPTRLLFVRRADQEPWLGAPLRLADNAASYHPLLNR